MKRAREVDKIIWALLETNHSIHEIARLLHVGRTRVRKIKRGEILDHQIGRPRRYGDEIIRFIERETLRDACLTDSEMLLKVNDAFHITMARSTMASIQKKLGFNYQPPLQVQLVTQDQKVERVQFATDILKGVPENTIIIFTDESRFCLGPDSRFRHIRRGEWNSTAFAEKTKYSQGYMYWGAIGPNFKSPLIKCPVTLNAEEYMKALEESGLFQTLDGRYGARGYYFMQDGAPCHTASQSLDWIQKRCKILPGWPPN